MMTFNIPATVSVLWLAKNMSINPKQEQLHQFKTVKYIKMVDNPDKIELGQAVQLQSSENYETTRHEMGIKRDKQKTLEDKT